VSQPIRFLALVLALLVPCVARAEVPIRDACRIPNRPPGRCGWCALETLGRHHGIEALYGLTDEYACMAGPSDLESALTARGVRYRVQYPGSRNKAILQRAVRDGLGAAVGFRELVPGKGGHIVTLVDFGTDWVRVIDPNDQDRRTRTMSLERFLYWWDGFALVLDEDRSRPHLLISQPQREAFRAKRAASPKAVYTSNGTGSR
jgi:hypothetical protein